MRLCPSGARRLPAASAKPLGRARELRTRLPPGGITRASWQGVERLSHVAMEPSDIAAGVGDPGATERRKRDSDYDLESVKVHPVPGALLGIAHGRSLTRT